MLIICLFRPVHLGSDFLVGIIVGSTGGRVVFLRQVDFNLAVFQEEVDGCAVFSFGFVGDVAVDSSILCTLEGKCSIFDDSRVQFYEFGVLATVSRYTGSRPSATPLQFRLRCNRCFHY